MKTSHHFLAVLLAVLLCLSLTACGDSSDDDGQLLVGRYELRVKARRSAIIQDHRAAAL